MDFEERVKKRFQVVNEIEDLKFKTGDVLKIKNVCFSERSRPNDRIVIVEAINEEPSDREYIFSLKYGPGKGQLFCRQRSNEYSMKYIEHIDNYKPNYEGIEKLLEEFYNFED